METKIKLLAFWQLNPSEQAWVKSYMRRELPHVGTEYEEWNYSRYDTGIIDWVEFHGIFREHEETFSKVSSLSEGRV